MHASRNRTTRSPAPAIISSCLYTGRQESIRWRSLNRRLAPFNEIKKPTYMVLTLAVNEVAGDVKTEIADGLVKSELTVDEKTLKIESPVTPTEYEKTIRTVKTSGR